MLSTTASPMKRQSVAIPESMQKLIAKLQNPKKNKKMVNEHNPLSLEHKTFKKSKLDSTVKKIVDPPQVEFDSSEVKIVDLPKVEKDVTVLDDEEFPELRDDNDIDLLKDNLPSTSVSRIEENDDFILGLDQVLNNNEKTFIYPQVKTSVKNDDGPTAEKKSMNSEIWPEEDPLAPITENKSDLKSAFKTFQEDKDARKWVTFNELQNLKRGSFVDELYDNADDEQVDTHLPHGVKEKIRVGKKNKKKAKPRQLSPRKPTEEIHSELLNAIQRIKDINNMISNANEKILNFQDALRRAE